MKLLKQIIRLLQQKIVGDIRWGIKNGLKCGDGVTSMGGASFGSEPYLVELGNRVRLSTEVSFVTHDGGTYAFRREKGNEDIVRFGRIVVGDDTFIGMRAIIMPGVTIGRNCVVGAGSIVTRDVPDRCVVAGIPARIICTTDEYAQKCRAMMPENFDFNQMKKNKREYLTKMY